MMRRNVILFALCLLGVTACSTTRSLGEGEYLLRKNTIVADDPSFNAAALGSYVAQKPKSYFLGLNPLLSVYNWSGDVDFPNLVALGDFAFDSTMVHNIVLHRH